MSTVALVPVLSVLLASSHAFLSRWMARQTPRPQRLRLPFSGIGLHLEASEVARCVAAGETQSPLMPLDESIAIMDTLATVRAQMGLQFPGE